MLASTPGPTLSQTGLQGGGWSLGGRHARGQHSTVTQVNRGSTFALRRSTLGQYPGGQCILGDILERTSKRQARDLWETCGRQARKQVAVTADNRPRHTACNVRGDSVKRVLSSPLRIAARIVPPTLASRPEGPFSDQTRLDRPPPQGLAVKVNLRCEIGRFGLIVGVSGRDIGGGERVLARRWGLPPKLHTPRGWLQGYLAHKKQPPPGNLQ